MSEKEYLKADQEVLSLNYKCHGSGGELPVLKSVSLLPADQARIFNLAAHLRKKLAPAIPGIRIGLLCLGILLAARIGWMSCQLAVISITACLLQLPAICKRR